MEEGEGGSEGDEEGDCTIRRIGSLIQEDSDDNWMMRALSRTTFGLPEYHKEIKLKLQTIFKLTKSNLKVLLPRVLI